MPFHCLRVDEYEIRNVTTALIDIGFLLHLKAELKGRVSKVVIPKNKQTNKQITNITTALNDICFLLQLKAELKGRVGKVVTPKNKQ